MTSATTVLGDIDPQRLGTTLPHERLIHRISNHSGKPDNTCVDVELVAEELNRFRARGGGAICDVTPIGVGRDPEALRQVSRLSGLHIVSGLGLYQLEVWPDSLHNMSAAELADFLVAQASGDAHGIAAGLLGEIASHNEPDHADWRKYRMTDEERQIFRAVADQGHRIKILTKQESFKKACVPCSFFSLLLQAGLRSVAFQQRGDKTS